MRVSIAVQFKPCSSHARPSPKDFYGEPQQGKHSHRGQKKCFQATLKVSPRALGITPDTWEPSAQDRANWRSIHKGTLTREANRTAAAEQQRQGRKTPSQRPSTRRSRHPLSILPENLLGTEKHKNCRFGSGPLLKIKRRLFLSSLKDHYRTYSFCVFLFQWSEWSSESFKCYLLGTDWPCQPSAHPQTDSATNVTSHTDIAICDVLRSFSLSEKKYV